MLIEEVDDNIGCIRGHVTLRRQTHVFPSQMCMIGADAITPISTTSTLIVCVSLLFHDHAKGCTLYPTKTLCNV